MGDFKLSATLRGHEDDVSTGPPPPTYAQSHDLRKHSESIQDYCLATVTC
jgi:hypothetical protein